MALSKSAQDKQRRMANKQAILELDVAYKTSVYIAAYETISRIRAELDNGGHVSVLRSLISQFNERDETAYRNWNQERHELKRSQRKSGVSR